MSAKKKLACWMKALDTYIEQRGDEK